MTTEITAWPDLLDYSGGIWQGVPAGAPWDFVFDVKLVGWGLENGAFYWVAEGHWGAEWGENGYFRMADIGMKNGKGCIRNNTQTLV